MTAQLQTGVAAPGGRGWLKDAVCADPAHDPDWWWPTSTSPLPDDADWTATARALKLCQGCPVLAECRDDFYAVERGGDPGGVRFATLPGGRVTPKSVHRRQARADQRAHRQQQQAAA